MPVSDELLEILCCPKTQVPLERLSDELLVRLNAQIQEGALVYTDGAVVSEPLTEGLITQDGRIVYRIDDEIPIMLVEKGIPMESESSAS